MPAGVLTSYLRDRLPTTFAMLGLASGVLSAVVGFTLRIDILDALAKLFFLSAEMLPIGLLFAAAMASGLWIAKKGIVAPILQMVVTLLAWSAAIHSAIWLHKVGGGDSSHLGPLLAGIGGGAIGAGLTHAGANLVAVHVRDIGRVGFTCAIGAIAGILFYLGDRNYIDARILFLVWQPAVAWSIGSAFGTSDRPAS